MKAYRIRPGAGIGSLALVDSAPAAPGPGQVRLRIRAVSLNARDLMVAEGSYPTGSNAPVVPLSDAVAEVVELGAGAVRFKVGDRVATAFFPNWHYGAPNPRDTAATFGASVDGVLAQELTVDEGALYAVPGHLSDAEAATLSCAGVTAWNALFVEAALKPGQSVLLLGTGGVSIWGLQLAKAAGLRAFITSSSDDKLARARELGADGTVNYRQHPEWQARVRELTDGRGVDAVLEVGGKDTLQRSIDATAMGGTVAVIGGVSGYAGVFNPFTVLAGAKRLAGIFVGNRGMSEDLARFVGVAGIAPVVDRAFGFGEAVAAYEHLASGAHFGKVVIQVGD